MVTAREIREIDAERSLAGMPHVWGVESAEHAICRLPGDEDLHLVAAAAPGCWTLRQSTADGDVVMEVEGSDLFGAMGTVEFRFLAIHPRRLVRAVKMLDVQSGPESEDAPARYGGVLLMPSATNPDVHYSVDNGRSTCTCPDNRYRRKRCKHLIAAQLLQEDD